MAENASECDHDQVLLCVRCCCFVCADTHWRVIRLFMVSVPLLKCTYHKWWLIFICSNIYLFADLLKYRFASQHSTTTHTQYKLNLLHFREWIMCAKFMRADLKAKLQNRNEHSWTIRIPSICREPKPKWRRRRKKTTISWLHFCCFIWLHLVSIIRYYRNGAIVYILWVLDFSGIIFHFHI